MKKKKKTLKRILNMNWSYISNNYKIYKKKKKNKIKIKKKKKKK